MVAAARVEEVLTETFYGQKQLARALTPACHRTLLSFRPWCQDFSDLEKALESVLFNGLYSELGDSMTFYASKRHIRIHMEDLPELADRVLLPLFEDLTVCATNCRRLHDYAMSAGSASAMQVLIASYDHLLPEGEADVMKRILRGRPGPV